MGILISGREREREEPGEFILRDKIMFQSSATGPLLWIAISVGAGFFVFIAYTGVSGSPTTHIDFKGGYIYGALTIVGLLPFILLVAKSRRKSQMRSVEITRDHFAGWTFGGKRIEVPWSHVREVSRFDNKADSKFSSLTVSSPRGTYKLSGRFLRFRDIVDVVEAICDEYGIWFWVRSTQG